MKDFTTLTALERADIDELAFRAYRDVSLYPVLAEAAETPVEGIHHIFRISTAVYDAMGERERGYFNQMLRLPTKVASYERYRHILRTLHIK